SATAVAMPITAPRTKASTVDSRSDGVEETIGEPGSTLHHKNDKPCAMHVFLTSNRVHARRTLQRRAQAGRALVGLPKPGGRADTYSRTSIPHRMALPGSTPLEVTVVMP